MERLLRENPANSQLLGEGPESWYTSFTRTQFSEIHRLACGGPRATFPIHWRQLIEYAQVRLSEPCIRGSLKLLHNSNLFLQEVAGLQDKFTDDALYGSTWKELLASAIPGKPPRQAPRFPVTMLAVLEDMVVSAVAPTC